MFDPSSARRRTAAVACITGALLIAGGCASDNGGNPFKGMKNPLAGSIGNPFQGPSEAGFFALVRKHCASYSIGDQDLGVLNETEGSVGKLTAELYRGDISNDEYLNLLLQDYPAEDANVPATGCVINQLDTCLSTKCQLTQQQSPEMQPEMQKADAMVASDQQQAVEEAPMADRAEVEMLIDQADEETSGDLSTEP
jgi:hypothetical protein